MVNTVSHIQPLSDVVVYRGNISAGDYVSLFYEGSELRRYVAVQSSIRIPVADLEYALTRQLQMVLTVDGQQFGGYILFLPESESIDYFEGARINRVDGSLVSIAAGRYTDFVDVRNAREFVVSGGFANDNSSVLFAYDENREPVRSLVDENVRNYHVVYDGSYSYIRASSSSGRTFNLLVYFRDRRH